MIHDIKLGFKVMKYGLNFKMTLVGLLVCCGGGLLIQCLLPVAGIGVLYLGVGGMLFIQLLHSVSVSTMVQSSPYKKRLQTTVPTVFASVWLLIANTASVVAQKLDYQRAVNNTNPFVSITYEPGEYETGFLFAAFALVFIVLYGVLSMKCFWLSTIIFLAGFFGFMQFLKKGEISYIVIPEWSAILWSYGIVLLGCFVIYIISCITYRREYSKATFGTLLKRAG